MVALSNITNLNQDESCIPRARIMPELDDPQHHVLGDEEALTWLQDQSGRLEVSVAELAGLWGWGRTRVYRRLERWEEEGWITKCGAPGGRWFLTAAPTTVGVLSAPADRMDSEKSQELAPKLFKPFSSIVRMEGQDPDSRPDVRPSGGLVRMAISAALVAIALAIGWFGIQINAWYGATLGRTAEASGLLSGLSVAADALALLLPAVSRQLWFDRQVGVAAIASSLWVLTAAVALLASIGFASLNIADVTAARTKTASEVERLAGRRDQLTAERLAIREPRSVVAIDAEIQLAQPGAAAVWKATAGCTDVTLPKSGEACAPLLALRQARGEAMRRDAIDAELRDLTAEIGRGPAVTVADPQADAAARLARWLTAGLVPITPEDIAMARIAGIALLPQIGGLIMMLAMAVAWSGRGYRG
jgi:hypothetical protein